MDKQTHKNCFQIQSLVRLCPVTVVVHGITGIFMPIPASHECICICLIHAQCLFGLFYMSRNVTMIQISAQLIFRLVVIKPTSAFWQLHSLHIHNSTKRYLRMHCILKLNIASPVIRRMRSCTSSTTGIVLTVKRQVSFGIFMSQMVRCI